MSIFNDSGVVLQIIKLNNKEFLYTIFTNTFGKVLAKKKFSRKEKNLDLGYYVNFEIETSKNSDNSTNIEPINKIKSIKILSEFSSQNKNFSEINNYLILLNSILKKTAFGVANHLILETVKQINKYSKNDLEIKLILANIKIINLLGELDINNKNPTVSKILNFINNNNIENILKLIGINDKIKKELQNIL